MPSDAPARGKQVLPPHQSQRRLFLQRFLRHRLAVLGTIMLGFILFLAVAASLFTPLEPFATDLKAVRVPPGSPGHPLGTDLSGRDVWSRVVFGARTSLVVGLGAVSLYVAIGLVIGAISGFFGGIVDQLFMRITDMVMSVPPLLMVIVFVSVVGPSLFSVIVVIGLLGWPATARLVRGQMLALRETDYVTAARVIGQRDLRIVTSHLLPNALGPLTVLATFGVASAILLEAGLSFLGLGVRPPVPSWGAMINAAQSPTVLIDLPWLWVPPGLAIALTVLSVNFIGDGLRDALDPRATRRA